MPENKAADVPPPLKDLPEAEPSSLDTQGESGNTADLVLLAVQHRKSLFDFIFIFSALFMAVYLLSFIGLFFGDIERLEKLCKLSPLVLIPLSLLLVAPITMILTLLHKLYKKDQKTPDDESLVPQIDAVKKVKDITMDVLKDVGMIK